MTPKSCLESADKIRCRVNGLGTYRHSDYYADMHAKQTCMTSGSNQGEASRQRNFKEELLYRGACEEEGGLYRGACSCITCMTRLLSEVTVIMHDKSALTSTEEVSAGKCDDGGAD